MKIVITIEEITILLSEIAAVRLDEWLHVAVMLKNGETIDWAFISLSDAKEASERLTAAWNNYLSSVAGV